jgi:hypothetical protein
VDAGITVLVRGDALMTEGLAVALAPLSATIIEINAVV